VRQQACLQEKVAKAKQSAQMKSGLSKLFSIKNAIIMAEAIPREAKYRLFIAVPFWQESISVLV
jgi:hypothetical protein